MIVVTTPMGQIGHQVLEDLLRHTDSVRAIVRDPARLPPQTRERIEIVKGSHGDADVVSKAFTGADSVFWLVPPDPHAKSADAANVDFIRPACTAFKTYGIKRVVGISALGRGTPAAEHAALVTAPLKMDTLIPRPGAHSPPPP